MKNIILLFFVFGCLSTYAQNNRLNKADKKFENLAYKDAIEIYEDLADNGYEDEDMLKKLGDSYYFNAKYVDAQKWYSRLYKLNANLPPQYMFRYGQSLKATGNYKEADAFFKSFYASQGLAYKDSQEYLKTIEKNSYKYLANKVSFNTPNSDYPAYLVGDNLYVVSASSNDKKTPWNNEPTSDIFRLKGSGLDQVGGDVNTKFNEGSLVITKNGKTMFFTRNDYYNKQRGKDSDDIMRIKLYSAENVNGKWENILELPFNNSEYSVGHPALNSDDTILYFVSDMPSNGNKGETDIYQVAILGNNRYGEPLNMATLNTPGKEMFPFVAEDSTLYFSSNGHPSTLGGLDVFKATLNGNTYGNVTNVGKPINSSMDDLAFVINSNANKGYFSSNRSRTTSDDIYNFVQDINYVQPADNCTVTYKGVVRDQRTGIILENALVSLIDTDNKIIAQKVVEAGLYDFGEMECGKAKFIRAEKEGYQTDEVVLNAPTDGLSTTELKLTKRNIDVSVGTDLGYSINPIYFDYDKSFIRSDARIELQKIISIMKDRPALNIDVRSHTDSRAPDSYNLSLSNRRAKSTIDYIVRGGIDRSRISGRGYGETELTNECSNGVKCSEEQHQQNRRSEFIIMKN